MLVRDGFDFSFDSDVCGDCRGYCCRGKSGKVWIDDLDAQKISSFLGINVIDFLHQFIIRHNNRLGLKECLEEGSYHCVFFNESLACTIYEVRPRQCRSFPFWGYYKKHRTEAMKDCPGIRMTNFSRKEEG